MEQDHVNVPSVPDKKAREHQAMDLAWKLRTVLQRMTNTSVRSNSSAWRYPSDQTTLGISPRGLLSMSLLDSDDVCRGNSFRSINEHETAVKDFTMAIELEPECPTYYANRGASRRKLSQTADALEDFTIAIELDTKKGNHYFNRASVLSDAGYYAEAIVDFTKALEDSSGGPRMEFRALHSRGNCYRRMGNLKLCEADMLQAIKLEPRNPVGYNSLGQCYIEFGDVDNAVKNFTSAINLQDSNATYLNNRGQALFRQGRDSFRAALIDFNAAIKVDGKDPQAYYNRGLARLAIAFEEIVKKDNAKHAADVKLAMTEPGDSDDEGCKDATSKLLLLSTTSQKELENPMPNSAQLTGVMSAEEQLEAAIADLDMACALEPKSTRYLYGKAMIEHLKALRLADVQETKATLQAVLKNDPAHIASRYHLAMLYHAEKKFDNAVEELTDLIDRIPTEPRFYQARGLVFQEIGMHELAIDDFTTALSTTSTSIYLYHRGESFLRLGHFQKAVDDLTAAIHLDSKATAAMYNARGLAQRHLGLFDEAIADLTMCIDLHKRNACYRLHRSLCYIDTKQSERALDDLNVGLRLTPRDSRLLYNAGLASFHLRDFEDSINKLMQALKYNPPEETLSDLYYHLGLGFANLDEHMQAVEFFTYAIDQTTSRQCKIKYVHERAKALQLEGYHEEAIVDFSLVLHHNPTNAHAHFRRAFAYKALGVLQACADDLEKAKLLDPLNPKLVTNYKTLHDIECVVLCAPGQET
ncbi:unnamed protein product, partial [Aphanomyces euteiches]